MTMVKPGAFSAIKRWRSPSLGAFLAPVDLRSAAMVQMLLSVSKDLLSCFAGNSVLFQRKNFRSLVRKIEVFSLLLDCLNESGCDYCLCSSAMICCDELYLLLHRSKLLLDYCVQSSRLWLLIHTQSIAGHFHELDQEISTLLDVFPVEHVGLNDDLKEQIRLMQKQARNSKIYVDGNDDALRITFFSFLHEFGNGSIPDMQRLRLFFIDSLEIKDAKSCKAEIEFLEERISSEGDSEPPIPVLNGFVAIVRYCRFLLFGFEEDDETDACLAKSDRLKYVENDDDDDATEISMAAPEDFCCPISFNLMQDPVIVSTGHTYDRGSISRWLEEGHNTCPKTGQILAHTILVPNNALRNLISEWCRNHGLPYESHADMDPPGRASHASTLPNRAIITANRATSKLLIQQLASGSQSAKAMAAREARLMAKTGRENRVFLAESGAIPLLRVLLHSSDTIAQENSVTAILNLSIYDQNKARIMEEGCLSSIVEVLRFGLTMEARENAAATLFSLSAVHDFKRRIADEEGAIGALSDLLTTGTPRGKKDAVTALFNLSTHSENCGRIVGSGAVSALVQALEDEVVAEEAAGALGLIVRQKAGAEAVMEEETVVGRLTAMMRSGTSRAKENAVATLLELCRGGGTLATKRVLGAPALSSLLQMLLFTGTKRTRRKAASLARVFQRYKNCAFCVSGLAQGHEFEAHSGANVSVTMSISVPLSN